MARGPRAPRPLTPADDVDGDPCERLSPPPPLNPRTTDTDTDTDDPAPRSRGGFRLERAFGAAFAARAVATCKDASLGRTALLRAAMAGDVHGVDACVRAVRAIDPGRTGGESRGGDQSSLDAVNAGDRHDVGALTLAAWRGHVDVVDYLLRNGADPNRRDNFGVAALHKAVGHGHLRAATRILGDGGCDVDLRVGDVASVVPPSYRAVSRHQTALHVACYPVPNAKLAAALLRYGRIQTSGTTRQHAAPLRVRRVRRGGGAAADARGRGHDGGEWRRAHAGDVVPAEGCNEGLMLDVLRGLD